MFIPWSNTMVDISCVWWFTLRGDPTQAGPTLWPTVTLTLTPTHRYSARWRSSNRRRQALIWALPTQHCTQTVEIRVRDRDSVSSSAGPARVGAPRSVNRGQKELSTTVFDQVANRAPGQRISQRYGGVPCNRVRTPECAMRSDRPSGTFKTWTFYHVPSYGLRQRLLDRYSSVNSRPSYHFLCVFLTLWRENYIHRLFFRPPTHHLSKVGLKILNKEKHV